MGGVFDRGKGSDSIKRFFSHTGKYKYGFVTFPPCVIFLPGSALLEQYNRELGCKLFRSHGYPPALGFLNSLSIRIVYVVAISGELNLDAKFSEGNKLLFHLLARVVRFNKAHKGYIHLLGMKGAAIFFFQPTCELLEVIKMGVYECQNFP
ncbi:hypothetical protein MKW92_005464, partial [Papaver armeniacum]